MLKILTLQNPFVVMKKYTRLTLYERVKIEEFKNLQYSPSKIAQKLGRSKSTITRELKRIDMRTNLITLIMPIEKRS